MKENPLVTVVTATYQKFESLYRTIESVMSQDYPNIEYIIADDGSPNFPKEELNKYFESCPKNKRETVKIIHLKENVGTVKNLNNAYRDSHGDYILNLSCGDVFYSNDVVSKIVEIFLNKRVNVIVTSRILYNGDFNPVCVLPHIEDRNKIIKLSTPKEQYTAFITARAYYMASGSAMYFSKEILEKYNYYDERFVLWEDGPFLSKFLWNEKIEYAYDLISIWYESGGVSTGKLKEMPSLLIKDTYKFYSEDIFEHYDELSYLNKRKIQFNIRRINSKTIFDKIFMLILFLPESISHIRYTRHLNSGVNADLKYLNRQ